MRIVLSMTFFIMAQLPIHVFGKEVTFTLIYTGSLSGELEPCGCSPKTDFGGLSRLSRYLLENKKNLIPYFLIDAGNFTDKDSPQGRLKAEAMIQSFNAMQYDAIAFMKNEQGFPSEYFVDLVLKNKIPYVSDVFPCKMSQSLKHKEVRIHISSDKSGYQPDHLNIFLTDLPLENVQTIKGWDIIITSSGEILEEPLMIDNTLILAAYPKGKKAGIVRLDVRDKGSLAAFRHTWQPLGNEIDDDKIVRNILNDYDARVASLLKESKPVSDGTTYVGVAKCGECHQLYVESWLNTRHAIAFSSLEEVGKAGDPECIVCHSVGFGEAGGFFTMETTPGLANVQCEECHGLNPDHMKDFSLPMRAVTEEVCLKCHTKENSPDFDYQTYFEMITH